MHNLSIKIFISFTDIDEEVSVDVDAVDDICFFQEDLCNIALRAAKNVNSDGCSYPTRIVAMATVQVKDNPLLDSCFCPVVLQPV